jgi:AbrB family looped-hinge helix DNA binding protein
MSPTVTVKADAKGRLVIPRTVRRELGIEPGDTFFLEADAERRVLHFAKAENPFDILVDHALEEHRAGRTRSLRDFAAENGIALDAE